MLESPDHQGMIIFHRYVQLTELIDSNKLTAVKDSRLF